LHYCTYCIAILMNILLAMTTQYNISQYLVSLYELWLLNTFHYNSCVTFYQPFSPNILYGNKCLSVYRLSTLSTVSHSSTCILLCQLQLFTTFAAILAYLFHICGYPICILLRIQGKFHNIMEGRLRYSLRNESAETNSMKFIWNFV